jgi:hypothetical protein
LSLKSCISDNSIVAIYSALIALLKKVMKYFFSWLLMVLLGNSVAMAQWSVLGSRKFSASMYSQHRIVANRFGVFTAVSGASGVTAYRYNNNANRWDTLGNTNFTRGIVDEIALKNDTLLIAYQDLATRRIGVMQFVNNAWSLVSR